MSDFLSQFTKENYDKEKMKIRDNSESKKELNLDAVKNNEEGSKENTNTVPVSNKEVEPETLTVDIEDFEMNDHKYIGEEPTEKDPDYKKKQQKKIIIGSVVAVALIISTVFIYLNMSQVRMPDFFNVSKQEVVTWAKKNKMDVIYEEEFNLEVEENLVISQSVEANSKIKKGSSLNVLVSKGADPDEKILIPEFETMKGPEIEEWVKTNKMRYIQIEYVYSPDIEKDVFMSFEITDKDITKDNFLRKNKGLIKISKGEEIYEKTILVPDFKGKTKSDVEAWMKEKEFVSNFVFEEAYDDKIMEGEVLSQGTAVGEKVAKNDVLTFTISKGKALRVPSYAGSELSTFDTVTNPGVTVISKEIYSMTASYGAFISQSVAAGTVLNDSPDTIVIVYYSIGKPFLKDIIGMSEGELEAYFYEFNSKGASLTYTINYVNECGVKGTVVRASKDNEFVSTSDHIYITVTKGSSSCEE